MLWLLLMAGGYAFGFLASALAPDSAAARRWAAVGATLGSASSLALAGQGLAGGTFSVRASEFLLRADPIAFRVDPLGAFFLGLVGLVGLPAAVYGFGYSTAFEGRASLRLLGAMLNAFLLSLSLVPLADNVLTFLFLWEAMSLTSYLLVMTETDETETVRAGLWYLAMTQVGLGTLLLAFLLLGDGGPLAFSDLRLAGRACPPGTRDVIFVLACVGFGSKAGLVPLHVWLPRAHPAAPSHVSALMSGVMIKMGVYGLLRVGLDLLGGGPAWWGALLMALGAVSAVLGVLYALMDDDIKRLLAYSSVENVGLIVLGVGAALLFQALGMVPAALLALSAALYHSLNHAAFKGLLFLGAGAVVHATGTRNLNRLGGLIRPMPWTAGLFLVGALAISGLPPLNGFVSEWLLFQALLPGIGAAAPLAAVLVVLSVCMLALTAGLAAAAFVKAFGIGFLALPRSPEAAQAHEAPRSMRSAMAALAFACAGLGLLAHWVLPRVTRVAAELTGATPSPSHGGGLWLEMPVEFGQMSPTLLALGLAVLIGAAWLAVRLLASRRPARVSATWGCGRLVQSPRMEYTSTAFAEPLRRVFAEVYRPTEDLSIDFHPESRYFVQSITYRSEILPWFERFLYGPAVAVVLRAGDRVRNLQSGSVHAYLAYLVLTLVALLGALVVLG